MNGGSSAQTTTQQAPSWQLPFQSYGLNQAQSQYQNTPQLVAPFAPQQEQAISNIGNLANNGGGLNSAQSYIQGNLGNSAPQSFLQSQLGSSAPENFIQNQLGGGGANAAQGYIQNTLGGNVMQNPELGNLFQLGADQIQKQMASEFANSGRNVDASQGQTAQALGNFASNLYGNAFNTEAQQQQGALSAQTGLEQGALGAGAGLQQSALGAGTGLQQGSLGALPSIVGSQLGLQQGLFGAGQNVQNLSQQYIQAPQNALNQYLSRVNGNLGATQTFNPAFNSGAGALGGGLVGANIGQGIGNLFGGNGGGYGGLIGALAGGLLGG